jgi:hypothetical protein
MSQHPSLFDPMPIDTLIDASRLVRTNDPHTSHEAASNASRRGPSQRRRVWESLKRLGDATDYELSIETGILRSSAAKRRQELVDLGHVVDTPFRRKTDTGTMAIVWRPSLSSPYLEQPHQSEQQTTTPSTEA